MFQQLSRRFYALIRHHSILNFIAIVVVQSTLFAALSRVTAILHGIELSNLRLVLSSAWNWICLGAIFFILRRVKIELLDLEHVGVLIEIQRSSHCDSAIFSLF